jgi:hypothetical protein
MKTLIKAVKVGLVVVVCFALLWTSACATKGQTGAAIGAGTGALIGGLANMHGSWGATALIGAGVGAGIGYLIGNEQDKKDAAARQKATEEELKPLMGTIWQVISINPEPEDEYRSIVSHFRADGKVVTTRTNMDGRVQTVTEWYRIVGSTLILSQDSYVENTRFKIDGDTLIIDYGNGSTVLKRIS